jgi:hypothetical protein
MERWDRILIFKYPIFILKMGRHWLVRFWILTAMLVNPHVFTHEYLSIDTAICRALATCTAITRVTLATVRCSCLPVHQEHPLFQSMVQLVTPGTCLAWAGQACYITLSVPRSNLRQLSYSVYLSSAVCAEHTTLVKR